jgi:hypothetical protein
MINSTHEDHEEPKEKNKSTFSREFRALRGETAALL